VVVSRRKPSGDELLESLDRLRREVLLAALRARQDGDVRDHDELAGNSWVKVVVCSRT
jgi:hypothetical protein